MSEFYILSLKWTRRSDRLITWWWPENNGYCYRLEEAGRYSADAVAGDPNYYDNGVTTKAVPCEDVDALAIRVGDAVSPKLTERSPDDRVVEYRHMLKFRPRKTKAMKAESERR